MLLLRERRRRLMYLTISAWLQISSILKAYEIGIYDEIPIYFAKRPG